MGCCEILTLIKVFPVDSDVLVTVTPRVFVVETQRAHQFVLDDACYVCSLTSAVTALACLKYDPVKSNS